MKNKESSRKTVAIACGLLFIAYIAFYNHLLNVSEENKQAKIAESAWYASKANKVPHTSNNINSGQRTRKVIKSIRVIPTVETYEVSRWVTSGDWSHDRDGYVIDIPSEKVVMDIDYVEDNWDDFISDPEDEISYPPELFQ